MRMRREDRTALREELAIVVGVKPRPCPFCGELPEATGFMDATGQFSQARHRVEHECDVTRVGNGGRVFAAKGFGATEREAVLEWNSVAGGVDSDRTINVTVKGIERVVAFAGDLSAQTADQIKARLPLSLQDTVAVSISGPDSLKVPSAKLWRKVGASLSSMGSAVKSTAKEMRGFNAVLNEISQTVKTNAVEKINDDLLSVAAGDKDRSVFEPVERPEPVGKCPACGAPPTRFLLAEDRIVLSHVCSVVEFCAVEGNAKDVREKWRHTIDVMEGNESKAKPGDGASIDAIRSKRSQMRMNLQSAMRDRVPELEGNHEPLPCPHCRLHPYLRHGDSSYVEVHHECQVRSDFVFSECLRGTWSAVESWRRVVEKEEARIQKEIKMAVETPGYADIIPSSMQRRG